MNTIVRIDDLGTTTIVNPTDRYMERFLDSLTKGLIQNLLKVTFEHISANQKFYVLDGLTVTNSVCAEHEVTSSKMLYFINTSLRVVSAYLSDKASARKFLDTFSNKDKVDLLIFAEFIFGGMKGFRQDSLMREWERQTDAGDDMRKEILEIISDIKRTLV